MVLRLLEILLGGGKEALTERTILWTSEHYRGLDSRWRSVQYAVIRKIDEMCVLMLRPKRHRGVGLEKIHGEGLILI